MDKSTRKSGVRPSKRKFKGNQHTIPKVQKLSASGNKLNFNSKLQASEFDGFAFIDKKIVFSAMENCMCCIKCHSSLKIESEVVFGLSEKINIVCSGCDLISSFRNSAMLGRSQKCAEINKRFIYAMRCLGQGLAGAQTFCGIMDMPPPISKKAYNDEVKNLKKASTKCAEESMHNAALLELDLTEDAGINNNITVSGDGTWKTRGHSSRIGACTLIGAESGKIIDTEVLSTRCKGCENWKGVRKGVKYEKWLEEHSKICEKDHIGSAGMMEVSGMNRIFKRSVSKHKVRYSKYIGDGDSKTFTSLQKAAPYGAEFKIEKIECVGHIQKRMGTRLRRRKAELKGKKLSDGKVISGKGRLTDDVIDKLTVYYGNAIRGNNMSVKDMQKAVWAIFYHKRSTDKEPLHDFCPQGENSWCPYQKAKVSGDVYRHSNTIPAAVLDSIKDIFKDLSMPSLLKKCVGGHTQNANESLNALIWKFCPKTSGSGKKIVQIAINEAVMCFNEGQCGRINVMREMGLQIGKNCTLYASEADQKRIDAAEKRALACTLEARRAKRRAKKAADEALKLQEGCVYAAGGF